MKVAPSSTSGPARYNRVMEERQKIIEDPLEYLPLDWRYAVLFFVCVIAAGVAVFSAH